MTKVRIFLERVSGERKIGDLTGNFCQLVRIVVPVVYDLIQLLTYTIANQYMFFCFFAIVSEM